VNDSPRRLWIPFPAAVPLSVLSGFAALQYEVLWARQLRELVGGTTAAAAWVVAWFFVGLSVGAWWLGPGADRASRPGRRFAALEAGIVVAVLPALWLDRLAGVVLPGLGEAMWGPAGGVIKALLAGAVVAPPAVLMGGTLPALGAAAIRQCAGLGRKGAWLYGLNTLGGAAGVVFVSFVSIPRIGMRSSFLVAIGCGLAAAVIAVLCDRRVDRASDETIRPEPVRPPAAGTMLLAAISGFGVLAAEVLVFISLSQVFRNATFCFAAMLAVVVATLGVAALLTPWITRRIGDVRALLRIVLPPAGLCAAGFPWLMLWASDNLERSGGLHGSGRLAYVARIVQIALLAAGPLFLLAGLVLPAVFELAGRKNDGLGSAWGRLLAANAAGAMAGAWAAGAVLMPTVGLWGGFVVIGAAYALAGLVLAIQTRRLRARLGSLAALAGVAVLGVMVWAADLPLLTVYKDEKILELRQGPEGIVAATFDDGTTLRVNNYYWLGGAADAKHERRTGLLPLLLHPAPRSVAHMGLGTGITAGVPLQDPGVESLVALELSPLVVELADSCLGIFASGLFDDDPRARIIIEDGRTFLRAQPARFDVITGDLFTPWNRGVGAAYTVEHFASVRAALRPGGVFCQWLATYQLDEATLRVIIATFVHVFPDALLLHGSFKPKSPTLGLVGFRDAAVPFAVIRARCASLREGRWARDPLLRHGTGVAMLMIGRADRLLDGSEPLNTADNGWVEFHAPVADIARRRVFLRNERIQTAVTFLQTQEQTRSDLRATLLKGAPAEATDALKAGAAAFELRLLRETQPGAADRLTEAKDTFRRLAPPALLDDGYEP